MSFDDDDPFDGLNGGPEDAFDGLPETPDEFYALLATGATFDLNDDGNGRRFSLYFGGDVLNVPRVGWFFWNGQVWAKDPDEIEIRRKCQGMGALVKREVLQLRLGDRQMEQIAREQELLDRLQVLAEDLDADGRQRPESQAEEKLVRAEIAALGKLKKSLHDLRAAHRRFANQTGNSARMKSMREEAGVRLARRLEDLDADPLSINTASGVVRFAVRVAADGRREADYAPHPHDRADLLTKIAPVRLDLDAECPRFDAFFERVQPDARMRGFLLRWFGVSMLGLIEQKLAFLYGTGANGKSVLVDLMARMAGDYAATAKIESLTGTNRRGGGDATPDLVPLIGARMVRASEPDEGTRWQEGLIKDLTGGEPILVRALHADFVEVRPIFSLTISGNHKPDIRGTDEGIWRRMMLVDFGVTIPPEERLPKAELDAILFAERDAIFSRRIIPAICDYLERGLQEPDAVLEATAEFRAESDPYGEFLNSVCCITGAPEDRLSGRDMVFAFQWWQSGAKGITPFSDRIIQRKFAEMAGRFKGGLGHSFTKGKSSATVYFGIRFTDAFDRAWNGCGKDAQGRPVGTLPPEAFDAQEVGL